MIFPPTRASFSGWHVGRAKNILLDGLFCRSYDLSTYPGKFLWLEAQKYPQWYKDFLKKQLLQVQLKVKFHSGSFAKTPETQARDLEKECYNCLKPEQKEKFLQNAEIVSFKFTADNSPRPRRGKRRLFRAAAWHLYLSMSRSDEKKFDLTIKLKSVGLTTLGARIQFESATSENESRAAAGRIVQRAGVTGAKTLNTLLDRVDELWKQVITEAPEIISWIDMSSKESWWTKVWAPGETSERTPQNACSGRGN